MTILVDTFEPDLIYLLIKQAVEASRQNLVQCGFADYLFFDCNGRRIQVERKQWGEILSNPDHVEEQLRREMQAADETVLLVEGIAEATKFGMDVYQKSEGKPYYRLARSYGTAKRPQQGLYARIQGWLWVLDHLGISVYRTANSMDTAMSIVAWYKNSQKKEHTTLQRYIKVRPRIQNYDPAVLTLMGIESAGIGETRARALIEKFGTVFNVLNAPVSELASVDGFGHGLAKKLVAALGRPWDESIDRIALEYCKVKPE